MKTCLAEPPAFRYGEYQVECEVTLYRKDELIGDDLELIIFNFDTAEGEYFDLIEYLNAVQSTYGEVKRNELEKCIYYVCLKENQGNALFQALKQPHTLLGTVSPILSPYQSLVEETLAAKDYWRTFNTDKGDYIFLRGEAVYLLEALNLINFEQESTWTYSWRSRSKEQSFFVGNIDTISDSDLYYSYLDDILLVSSGHFENCYQEVRSFFEDEVTVAAKRGFYE